MVYLPREEGQGLAEYGLILVLIAVVVVAALVLLGPEVVEMYNEIMNAITGVITR
ncbi:MAG: pilus assembly protein [Anaerolineae bacterium]|nr:pilus assembly protein [Anaerolineae bacterium]